MKRNELPLAIDTVAVAVGLNGHQLLRIAALLQVAHDVFKLDDGNDRNAKLLQFLDGGLIALAFHCFGEFNLHIPAVALSAALLAGMLVGFAPRERHRVAMSN